MCVVPSVIAPGRSRLGYLSAEGQWTRAGVIEAGAASLRLLIAERRPAHTIPLWDSTAPAATHGYQLRTVLEEAVRVDVTAARTGPNGAASAIEPLVAQAMAAECAELHVVCEAIPTEVDEQLDLVQAIARVAGRPVHVLTPRRTSELLALGAAEALDATSDAILVRVGAARTDVVVTRARRRSGGVSLPVGVESLSARHSDPPREGELKLLRHRVRATLGALPAARSETLVVAAPEGEAVRLLPALAGVERQNEVTLAGVRRALRTLQSTHPARLARSTRLPQEGLRRLPSVALILEALLERLESDVCRLAPRGLGHGVLIAAAEDPHHWWVDLETARLRRERLESAFARPPLDDPQPATGSTYT